MSVSLSPRHMIQQFATFSSRTLPTTSEALRVPYLHCYISFSALRAGQNLLVPSFRDNKDKTSNIFEVMWRIIESVALDPKCGKIVFLLDALDECQSLEQENLIKKLKGFEQMHIRLGQARNFKLFITSRPYWDIERRF
jgi:hypothetical protein